MLYIDDYITFKEAQGVMKRTLADYERILRKSWGEWCKKQQIIQIDALDRSAVRRYVAYLRTAFQSGTVALYIRNLRAYLKWLYAEGHTKENLAEAITPPRKVQREEIPPTIEEVKRMLSVCNDAFGLRDRAIILLLATTGIRRGEFCQLERKSIHIEGNTAWFEVHSGKAHQKRFCFLSQEATEALTAYLNSRDDDCQALFLSLRGKGLGYDGLYHVIKRRAEEAGLDPDRIHPHIFRKMFATLWIKNGGDEGRLMKIGGWSDRSLLEIYVKLSERRDLQRAHGEYAPRLF